MGETRTSRVKQVAEMFSKSRYDAKKSQEFMSLELGVSKKTIANWESGVSSPSMFQFAEWFRALNLNPFPYLLNMLFPKRFESINAKSTDEEVEAAFRSLCEQMPVADKRALLFIYTGKHGSSAYSLIQLLLAHLHTPLKTRLTQADAIQNEFELHKEAGTLICQGDIMPDTDNLTKARKYARIAFMRKEYGYSGLEEE